MKTKFKVTIQQTKKFITTVLAENQIEAIALVKANKTKLERAAVVSKATSFEAIGE